MYPKAHKNTGAQAVNNKIIKIKKIIKSTKKYRICL